MRDREVGPYGLKPWVSYQLQGRTLRSGLAALLRSFEGYSSCLPPRFQSPCLQTEVFRHAGVAFGSEGEEGRLREPFWSLETKEEDYGRKR